MNSLQIYTFQNRPVRVAGSPENPLFCASDVCAALGLSSPDQTVANIPADEKGLETFETLGGPQKLRVLNEAGLYRLIFRSSKPEAESFRRWVMHEVLPSIRKTGSYNQPGLSALDQFEAMIKAARAQEKRIADHDRKLAEVEALVIQANSYNSSNTGFLTVRAYANIHGTRWSLAHAQDVGQRAAKLCREGGIQTGRARDELFGQVNSYPVEVLDEVCGDEIAKGGPR